MRTLTITLATTILLAGPAAAQGLKRGDIQSFRVAKPDRCTPTAGIVDYRGKKQPSFKLGDQPPASQLYAVYTVVDGCPQPVVLRKGIGGNGKDAAPVLRTPPRATTAR